MPGKSNDGKKPALFEQAYAEYKAVMLEAQEKAERAFWDKLGIKAEDLHTPEVAAARFEAALDALCRGKHETQSELAKRVREERIERARQRLREGQARIGSLKPRGQA